MGVFLAMVVGINVFAMLVYSREGSKQKDDTKEREK